MRGDGNLYSKWRNLPQDNEDFNHSNRMKNTGYTDTDAQNTQIWSFQCIKVIFKLLEIPQWNRSPGNKLRIRVKGWAKSRGCEIIILDDGIMKTLKWLSSPREVRIKPQQKDLKSISGFPTFLFICSVTFTCR